MKRVDERYLQSLHEREKELDEKTRKHRQEQGRANELLLEHVKKELQLLMDEKDRMDARNENFLKEFQNYSKDFGKVLP